MPETLNILENESSKKEKYLNLLPQIKSLIEDEDNLIANLSNVSAALKQTFNFWWIGFYLVCKSKSNELVLGPFQGPIACTRIRKGKGVCGTSWERNETIVVPDVELFPGHIACSSESKSEIVVPIRATADLGNVFGVLDVDSEHLNHFDQVDAQYLEELCALLVDKFLNNKD